MKPLDGIVVLDLTRLLPGALATMVLANFGAEVIKVEEPGSGDYARTMPPLIAGQGAYFLLSNSAKKSIAVNLKLPKGKRILRLLALSADILIEGFRPGVMDKLELGYEHLSRQNSRLIYAAITGFGQDGPHSARAAHDLNYIALGGVLDALAGTNGSPTTPTVQIADVAGAMQAVVGVLLALLARERTGVGQMVDVSLFESILPLLIVPLAEFTATGALGGPGILGGGYACYHVYRTSDGRSIALGAVEKKFWAAFCSAIGQESFIEEQFVPERQAHLIHEVSEILARKCSSDWIAFFQSVDTCVSPVNNVSEVLQDPGIRACRGLIMPDDPAGAAPRLGVIPKLSRTPGEVRGVPPKLGQDTRDLLLSRGFSEAEIDEMKQERVIQIAE